jgi:hypothetical protein
MAKDDIYQVTTTFVITLDGGDVEYHVGELVDGSDPAYKLVPQHFGPLVLSHRKPTAADRKAAAKTEEAEDAPVEEPDEKPAGKPVSLSGLKGR